VQEKRRHPRVTVSLKVRCEIKGQPSLEGIVVDLSVGGVFIDAPSAPAFGTEIVIVGDFPGAPGLELPAVVRWTKPGGFGVQFGLLGARETHMLTTLVQRPKP
jgi:type IV pilus assembly protein PilZ